MDRTTRGLLCAVVLVAGAAGTAGALSACSSSAPSSGFTATAHGDASTTGDGSEPTTADDAGSLLGSGETGATCVNLECQVVDCKSQGKPPTTISGTVVTGTTATYGTPDPVYNAIVYVPNATVQPFTAGVSCDKCGTPVSGSPVTVGLSLVDGTFSLSDAPTGANVPFVVQIGRWRRQVTIPNVVACQDNPLPQDLTRLPRNKSEGDIPHIAIATSTFDEEECIFLKMGVDPAEFTIPSANGRIHLYTGTGASLPNGPDMSTLWTDVNVLKQYDLVQLPCESVPDDLRPPVGQNMVDYANAGGRVFATDLSYPWYESAPGNWPGTAQWTTWGGIDVDPLPSIIDQGFPKGKALAAWMQALGATTTLGDIDIHDTYHVLNGVNAPTTRWLYSTKPATVQTISFNTPVGVSDDQQCGRAVFHNAHVAGEQAGGGLTFPAECNAGPLTPQERLMEFMLLDLSSCVQGDDTPPQTPPLK